jgi:hypothetical protein
VSRESVTPAPGGVPEWPIGTALKAVAGSNVSRGFESRPLCLITPMSTYRLDRGAALVTVGVCLVVAAVAVFLAFLLAPLDNAVRWIGYLAIVVAVTALVGALRFALRPPVLLRLDDDGYRSRTRSSGGLFSGRWLDVEDVMVVDDVLCLTTTGGLVHRLPLGFVGRERMRLLRDMHDRLNAANGYRRFEV